MSAEDVTLTTHHDKKRGNMSLIFLEREPIESWTNFRPRNHVECIFEGNPACRLIIFKSNRSSKTIRLTTKEGKYKIGYPCKDKWNINSEFEYNNVPDWPKGSHPKTVEYHVDCIIITL